MAQDANGGQLPTTGTLSGLQEVQDINALSGALFSGNSGATEPPAPAGGGRAYWEWYDTANKVKKRRKSADSAWVLDGTLAEAFAVTKSTSYSFALSDHGTTFNLTGATANTYTVPASSTLMDGWKVRVKNNSSAIQTIVKSGADTIDGGGAAIVLWPGDAADLTNDGVSNTVSFVFEQVSAKLQPITVVASANAMVVTLNPTTIDFRSTNLSDGTVTRVEVPAAITLTIPSGASLGTLNGALGRIMILAQNNAGTVELAVVNQAGGVSLDESALISTTAISAAATANNVIYSTAARTNVAFRCVGYFEATETTAGTWAANPSLVQGSGGQAMAAMQSIGMGQTWQSVTRNSGVTYYNTTGRPIYISVDASPASGSSVALAVSGVTLATTNGIGTRAQLTGIIPPGAPYVITDTGASTHTTTELR